ncbi:MAG TPA: hypothetical protein VMH48_07560 [Methylomirabilota bacterium]|nr:hypothetical protein [Methylomirabilota bacterium]
MTDTPARSLNRTRHFPLRCFLCGAAVFLGIVFLAGCGARKRPKIPWATAVQAKPVIQPKAGAGAQPVEAAPPEFNLQMPPFAAVLIPVRGEPVRPHITIIQPGRPGTEPDRAAAPIIAPQLSPQESATAQQETNQSLSVAEKNLATARGKQLNAAQTDMVSKINGFVKDAREAAQSGDWSRARSLAKKAEVLSNELVGSF